MLSHGAEPLLCSRAAARVYTPGFPQSVDRGGARSLESGIKTSKDFQNARCPLYKTSFPFWSFPAGPAPAHADCVTERRLPSPPKRSTCSLPRSNGADGRGERGDPSATLAGHRRRGRQHHRHGLDAEAGSRRVQVGPSLHRHIPGRGYEFVADVDVIGSEPITEAATRDRSRPPSAWRGPDRFRIRPVRPR